jgi:hypothetical protein
MRIKDGELHNRGGRGDSVPCVEDTTIRAMQIKSLLMQVSDWFDLENPTPLIVRQLHGLYITLQWTTQGYSNDIQL